MDRFERASQALHNRRLRHPGLSYLFSKEGGTTGSLKRDVAIKIVRAYERDRWRLSTRRLGSRVDRIPVDRPIFLLGTQGASETIIGRCLRRNRVVVSVSGNSDHWTGADEMGTVRNRMRKLPAVLWGSKHRSDIRHAFFGTDQPYACDALLPHYRRTADDATESGAAQFKRLLKEHLAVYAHDPESARFMDKTHAYTVKIPLLAALLEEARPFFVLVVRNPYEVCRWAVERKPQLFRSGLLNEKRLRVMAEHWSNTYGAVLRDAETVPNVAVVRFEDFLVDSEAVVRALCKFVELDFEPAMVPRPGQKRPFATLPDDRKWYPLYRSDWLDELPADEAEIIGRRCDSLAKRFGYDPTGASPALAPIEILGPPRRSAKQLAAAVQMVLATRP